MKMYQIDVNFLYVWLLCVATFLCTHTHYDRVVGSINWVHAVPELKVHLVLACCACHTLRPFE